MLGTIPSLSRTYEVIDSLDTLAIPIVGKIYYDKKDGRLYIYSPDDTRSNPNNGYFPIWNGKNVIISKFSNEKYLKDVTPESITKLSANINADVAKKIRYQSRRIDNDTLLTPTLCDEDNMFTQTIKSIIKDMEITMIDLVDMCNPPMSQSQVENYYSSLNKISLMRMEKWNVWLSNILHLSYVMTVYKNGKMTVQYKWPVDTFDTGVVKYQSIAETNDDPLKKIIKILMTKENISKATLRATNDTDDYTINNMMTTLNSDKPMSAQIFSRFIRMTGLAYSVELFDNKNNKIFTYKEGI